MNMTNTNVSETSPALLARLIGAGGKILIVGGTINDLPPPYHSHPALILWDDTHQDFSRKEVPSNVKAILWTRQISHASAGRLNAACIKLRAIKFPMLKTREIKRLLAEVMHEAPEVFTMPLTSPPTPEVDMAVVHIAEQSAKRQGQLGEYVTMHFPADVNWAERGAIAREGRKLFEKITFKTTESSVIQALRVELKKKEVKTGAYPAKTTAVTKPIGVVKTAKAKADDDDFAELDRLCQDAIAAMKLVQEHLPKVRREAEQFRAMRDKMRLLLGNS